MINTDTWITLGEEHSPYEPDKGNSRGRSSTYAERKNKDADVVFLFNDTAVWCDGRIYYNPEYPLPASL